MTADENTPLIAGRDGPQEHGLGPRLWRAITHVETRVLFASFLITLAFSFTQVPIFFAFRLMECDVYYSKNPPYDGTGDRCDRNEIAAGTATEFSILGASTVIFGTINLFVAGWTVKKVGPRLALMVQTLVAAIRVSTQVFGLMAGGQAGIIIFQCTQIITIIGGPSGYILIINIIASEVVEPMRRTAVFGMLQGTFMLGAGTGLLIGGRIGDTFGIRSPFEAAFCTFMLSTAYCRFVLPYISPDAMSTKSKAGGIAAFFAPLKVITPQRILLKDGVIRKHYGVMFLCAGVFIGVIATGYAPLLIQMYASAAFHFTQGDAAFLMAGFAFMRAFFLILIFPWIVDNGRKWYTSTGRAREEQVSARESPDSPLPSDASTDTQVEEVPVVDQPVEERAAFHFDLFFLRWSLLLDGVLTLASAFATQNWHLYLAAYILPFGSGTAAAAKGVITEMCPPSQRADALNALTLVESVGRLTTAGVFGFIFAALAEANHASYTFFFNAAIALLGMAVLLLSHFPPLGSTLVEDDQEEQEAQPPPEASENGE